MAFLNQPTTSSNSARTSLWKELKSSYVLGGILLFLSVNLLLLVLQPLSKVDPESLPSAHTWVWWATREYLQEQHRPAVVLLGSSLLMHPVSRTDADMLGEDLDYVHHHRSLYMESLLAKRLEIREGSCFNFALPGGMMSDDYIVARALFGGQRKPKLIVLGLSLRDFIDNGVHCAGATPAFRYLKRFTSVDDLMPLAMPELWQRFDYAVGKAFYLWGKKLEMQVALSEKVKQRLAPLMARFCSPSQIDKLDPARNMPSNLRAEVEEGMFIVKAHQPYSWEDNSREYRKRYRTGNDKQFAIQAEFLEKLMALCHAQDIRVLIVNMPLTQTNLALMPAGSYRHYLCVLDQASRRWHSRFVDLSMDSRFQRADFYDTAHMNSSGGQKLIEAIVGQIAGSQRLTASLASPPSVRSQLASQGHRSL